MHAIFLISNLSVKHLANASARRILTKQMGEWILIAEYHLCKLLELGHGLSRPIGQWYNGNSQITEKPRISWAKNWVSQFCVLSGFGVNRVASLSHLPRSVPWSTVILWPTRGAVLGCLVQMRRLLAVRCWRASLWVGLRLLYGGQRCKYLYTVPEIEHV